MIGLRASRRAATTDDGPARAPAGDRRGFTLVELMVGIMLLTTGMLALAAGAAVVMRQMTEAGTMGIAAAVAQTRIEQLRAGSCTTTQSGTATTRGVSESWTVTPMTRSAQLQVVVSYSTRRGTKSQTYTSTVPCT